MPKVSLLCVACLCYYFGLAVSSHFRRGTIQWRPVNPRAFDGEVSFCIYTTTILLERLVQVVDAMYIVGWLLGIYILLSAIPTHSKYD